MWLNSHNECTICLILLLIKIYSLKESHVLLFNASDALKVNLYVYKY